jgi:hypothetical protein
MPIDIENATLDPQIRHAGFFLRLAQRHPRQIGVAIGMSSRLQPPTQLAVVHQQHPLAIRADQPRRAGEMAWRMAALEYRGAGLQEIAELGDGRGLRREARDIFIEIGTYSRKIGLHDL